MAIEVREAKRRRDVQTFVDLPFELHRNDPIWSPYLKQDFARTLSPENPLWQKGRGERELLLAFDGDRCVGRVMCHVHHASNELHKERVGFFGYLEATEDPAVTRALMDEVERRHRNRGMHSVRGAYDPTITTMIGIVTGGFDEAATYNQSWNAPHLPKQLEELGYSPVYKAATFRLDDVNGIDPDSLMSDKQRLWLADPKVKLRTWDMANFERDVKAATALLNQSFRDNWGFVPLSDDEIDFMVGPMKRVVRPELTVFLEYEGKPVGVGMSLPDFNLIFRRMNGELFPLGWAQFLLGAKKLDGAVGQFIATSPELQNKGIMRIVISEMVKGLQANGFRTLDATWIGEVNAKSRASVMAIGMRPKHQLAVFGKTL
ncbi:MAG: hypothetical protein ACJ790_11570 [Myxococcaceae bacterium]